VILALSAFPTFEGMVDPPAPADAFAAGFVAALVGGAFAAAVDVLSPLLVPPHAIVAIAPVASRTRAIAPSFMRPDFHLIIKDSLLLLSRLPEAVIAPFSCFSLCGGN
jgi:hypothetical protein